MIAKSCTILLLFAFLAAGCASAPRQELQSARMAVAQARHADAPQWAPEDFARAAETLATAEALVRQGEYGKARNLLPMAENEAMRALERTRQEKEYASLQAAEAASEETAKKEARKKRVKPPPSHPTPPPAKPKPAPEPPPPPPTSYQVVQNETLWLIAGRQEVYGDPLLWPLLYQANRDQIKDPRHVYPGQILKIPRDVPPPEQEEAREKARASEIFPQEQAPAADSPSPPPQ